MEPKDQSQKTEEDVDGSSKHVLDYYRKYSQNRELPKYFSGTSVSYIPEITENFDEDEDQVENKINATQEEEIKDSSRASSALSNRKLEWDNGADIGYDNCQKTNVLHKSASLPVLSDVQKEPFKSKANVSKNTDKSKVQIVVGSSTSDSDQAKISTSSSSVVLPEKSTFVTTSSSASADNDVKNIRLTSSSSNSSSEQRLRDFANTLSFLKAKIGMPGAQSTPKLFEASKYNLEQEEVINPPFKKPTKPPRKTHDAKSTKDKGKPPSGLSRKVNSLENLSITTEEELKRTYSCENLLMENAGQFFGEFKKNPVVNLHVTKPVTVECLDIRKKPSNVSKIVQTSSLRSQSSKYVQTDSVPKKDTLKFNKKNEKNQLVFFVEHSENDQSNTCSTQTSSDVVASNSFEYVKSCHTNIKPFETKISSSDESNKENKILTEQSSVPVQDPAGNLRRTQRKTDLSAVDLESQSSSNDCFLGNLIAASQSDLLSEDVEKSLELLQKLIKSKKYDPVTKRRYIKKIIKKIAQSNYMEESSTSSELFFPKATPTNTVNFAPPANASTSESSDPKIPQASLQSNIPWYPAMKELPKSPVKSHFTEKPSSSKENSIQAEIIPVDARNSKKFTRFTLTNNEFSVNHDSLAVASNTKYDSNDINLYLKEQPNGGTENHYESSSGSYHNWKDDKTLSERLLEERLHLSKGDGDYLVEFAEKEREHQINWINNEISHLSKLKVLLQNCEKMEEAKAGAGLKPTVLSQEQMNNKAAKKTTTVYTVSDKNADGDGKSRNYIIETQLGVPGANQIKFQMGRDNYTVKEVNLDQVKQRKVLGEIDVVSDDSTTKLRVNTFCQVCKKTPCLCISDTYKNFTCLMYNTCPCYPTTQNSCPGCQKRCCMCPGANKSVPVHQPVYQPVQQPVHQPVTQQVHQPINQPVYQPEQNSSACPQCCKQLCMCTYRCFWCQRTPCICSWNAKELSCCVSCKQHPCVCGPHNGEVIEPDFKHPHKLPYTSYPRKDSKEKTPTNCDLCGCGRKRSKCVSECKYKVKLKDFCNENAGVVGQQINLETQTRVLSNFSAPTQTEYGRINTDTQTSKQQMEREDIATSYEANMASKSNNTVPHRVATKSNNTFMDVSTKSNNTVKNVASKSNNVDMNNECRKSCSGRKTGNSCLLSKKKSSKKKVDTDGGKKNDSISDSDSMIYMPAHKKTVEPQLALRPSSADNKTEPQLSKQMSSRISSKSANLGNIGSMETGVMYSSNEEFTDASTDDSDVVVMCACCKQVNVMDNVCLMVSEHRYPLCSTCLCQNPGVETVCYDSADHICTCYTEINSDRITKFPKKTMGELDSLMYCACEKSGPPQNIQGLTRCACPTAPSVQSTAKDKQSIAYLLTLEDEPVKQAEQNNKKRKVSLEEIRIKIPCPYYKKKRKNHENLTTKQGRNESNRQLSHHSLNRDDSVVKKKKSMKVGSAESQTSIISELKIDSIHKNSLNDYLSQNRPDFIDGAERRRRNIQQSKIRREDSQEAAKLSFFQDTVQKNNLKGYGKLYSHKEMKDINKKNYQKLPEVQDKIIQRREEELRNANKLIVHLFAKKVQCSVLKGKKNFPIDVNVINLACTNNVGKEA